MLLNSQPGQAASVPGEDGEFTVKLGHGIGSGSRPATSSRTSGPGAGHDRAVAADRAERRSTRRRARLGAEVVEEEVDTPAPFPFVNTNSALSLPVRLLNVCVLPPQLASVPVAVAVVVDGERLRERHRRRAVAVVTTSIVGFGSDASPGTGTASPASCAARRRSAAPSSVAGLKPSATPASRP